MVGQRSKAQFRPVYSVLSGLVPGPRHCVYMLICPQQQQQLQQHSGETVKSNAPP